MTPDEVAALVKRLRGTQWSLGQDMLDAAADALEALSPPAGMVMVPRWTILFNDDSGQHRLRMFSVDKEPAELLYKILSNIGRIPTKRPYHSSDALSARERKE